MVEVIDEVDQITATNLHKRVKVGRSKDEIAHLAVTFNQMLDRLEGSFMMQKNFVANASHEFRTPLTSMKGQIEVMLMQQRKEEDYIRTLSSINEDINNLSELLQSLSELAKLNVEFIEDAFEPIAVIDLVLDARAELLKNKPRYSIDLDVQNISGDEEPGRITGNVALIKSAITNLMDNACKFSPDMRVMVTILFSGEVAIQFRDEGIGISESEIRHIFEPFYRGNDTRNIAGHGIGLSLVKRIIEFHNGTITVKSKQGSGTVFTITMPIHRQDH
jgi:signal transduction histidine kinase